MVPFENIPISYYTAFYSVPSVTVSNNDIQVIILKLYKNIIVIITTISRLAAVGWLEKIPIRPRRPSLIARSPTGRRRFQAAG